MHAVVVRADHVDDVLIQREEIDQTRPHQTQHRAWSNAASNYHRSYGTPDRSFVIGLLVTYCADFIESTVNYV